MDNTKVLQAQKTKKNLFIFRVAISSLWVVLWVAFTFYIEKPWIAAPGIVVFLFVADWTYRKLYEYQVRQAYSSICGYISSLAPDSDIDILLRNDVVSDLCGKSSCGDDPYKDTWNSLFHFASERLTHLAFSEEPDTLSPSGEELLRLFIGLGSYGVAYAYISPDFWDRKVYDMAHLLDVFENARLLFQPSMFSGWRKDVLRRSRKVLYQDIYPQLVSFYRSLEAAFPSPVWNDISSAPYPCFIDYPSDIKRLFCSCTDMTAEEYILDECLKWCSWHIENFPTAYKRTAHAQVEPCNLLSSLDDLNAVYSFMKSKIS